MKAREPRTRKPRRGQSQSNVATVNRRHRGGAEARLGLVCLLPTPREVQKAVGREMEEMAALGRSVVGEARKRLLEGFKLRYYFGGQPFAYRETEQGKEILAVGFKAMRLVFRELTPEEDEAIASEFAEPW
jgi:hypothetical protein